MNISVAAEAQRRRRLGAMGSCNLPLVPRRELDGSIMGPRLRLIRHFEKKWLNGTKLKYYFFTEGDFKGKRSNEDLVRQAFQVWEDLDIGVSFEEVSDMDQAHIRVGFLQGDGAWSFIGTDVLNREYRAYFGGRTMNFGWDLTRDPRNGGLDTPVHEIGHTLGFPHEHQNPYAGIEWDKNEVYAEFMGPPNNWTKEEIDHNILNQLSEQEYMGSEWDPDSIMHYSFGPGLILEPAVYRVGLYPQDGLSPIDIEEVRKFYPPVADEPTSELAFMESLPLSIESGEQKNLTVKPSRTGTYVIESFGRSDTLMVLFEDVDGDLEVVGSDDDSGTHRNAKLYVRLIRGRDYVLRIRLYYSWSSGDTAILWHE